MPGEGKRQALYHNPVSYFGGLLTAGSTALVLATLLLLGLSEGNPYLGIFAFLVLPVFIVLGILVVLYGMRWESLRRRRAGASAAPAYPHVDLNQPIQRRRFAYSLVGGFLLLVLLAFVGYHGFGFTESVTFCGRVCHGVMEPEHRAYLASPHARVVCVECHVGSGASWYVKSKLSGVRQVFAVLFNSYERPIPVPIRDLRPARETCEECHWPQKFYGAQLIRNPHFRYDEGNTAEQITFLVKTGGGSPELGQNAGIHWHMIIESQVTFAARDVTLQEIPWISVSRPDGSQEVYTSTELKVSEDQLAELPRRVMDCMDCHNRPTHIFPAPETAIDTAMAGRLISSRLPWIKKVSVDALVREYPDRETASRGIREEISSFYAQRYPELAAAQAGEIGRTIQVVTDIYARSVFPEMKVNWTTYASNIGHRSWPGCFRCHDGKHASESGKILTTECVVCHTMPQRGPLAAIAAQVPASDQPWHPMELAGRHADVLCIRCHAAGFRPPTNCAECHKLDAAAPMMDMGCSSCHEREQHVHPISDCTSCHDSMGGLHLAGAHPDAGCTDCHPAHGWTPEERFTCLGCHDDMGDHYAEEGACAQCHDFT